MKFVTLCGMVGFGGGFLLISPSLRESLTDAISRGEILMTANQPFSYIGMGAFLVFALGFYMYRCSLPR